MRCKAIVMTFLCLLVLVATPAQNPAKTYIILAIGQGSGSTSFANALGSSVITQYEAIGIVVAQSSDPNFAAQAAALRGVQSVTEDQELQWISPNETVVQADNVIDDSAVPPPDASALPPANHETFSVEQWNLHQIHADQTAVNGDRGNGVTRARVAVLDTGIVASHIDIAANLNTALSASFVPTEPSFVFPSNGKFSHATHVAGIVAAPINGIGTQGVAPNAELVSVKVLKDSGSGSFASLIAGIEYASGPTVHADVINMSLGATFDRDNAGGGGLGPLLSALNRAINHAEAQGTLAVSAAGNAGVDLNGRLGDIPAQSGNGMAVSATGPIGFGAFGFNSPAVFDRLASYSNFGQSVIDVAAPGGDALYTPQSQVCKVGVITAPCFVFDFVLSPGGQTIITNPPNPPVVRNLYFFAAGTSMSAPHVSGEAALIVGKFGHMNPSQLRAIIDQSADRVPKPGESAEFGHGRINALAALQ
jgi:lantibiotic leader peptide-processing serine protease